MAGPRSPFPLRYLDKAVGFLVPRSQASFPIPRPRPEFRFFVSPFFVPCSQIYHNCNRLKTMILCYLFSFQLNFKKTNYFDIFTAVSSLLSFWGLYGYLSLL